MNMKWQQIGKIAGKYA